MNGNKLAQLICFKEGGKMNLPVAQVKEVVRCLRELIKENPIEVLRYLLK